jgi:hypothetical protein
MSKFFSILALGVGGLMLADILIHPTGTATAFNGAAQLAIPSINGLLGTTSSVTTNKAA